MSADWMSSGAPMLSAAAKDCHVSDSQNRMPKAGAVTAMTGLFNPNHYASVCVFEEEVTLEAE